MTSRHLLARQDSPVWPLPEEGMFNHPTYLVPVQHPAPSIRHDELSGGIPSQRRLVGMLLAAVRQHLPVGVENHGTTVLLLERADPFALYRIIGPHVPPPRLARCGTLSYGTTPMPRP